jgi:hypothetical protein
MIYIMADTTAFTIAIDSIEDYSRFSCETIKALCAVNKQCRDNHLIALIYNKYKAQHIFDTFNDTVISHVINADDEKYKNFFQYLLNVVIPMQNPQVNYWIMDMIMAEYKELLYNIYDYRSDACGTYDVEKQICLVYDNIIYDKNSTLDFDIEYHRHNPDDIIYDKGPYRFFDRLEIWGCKIIEYREPILYE